MKRRWIMQVLLVLAVLAIGTVAGFKILALEPVTGAKGEQSDEPAAAEGPHGGRLLKDGSFALEVTIFEAGVSPEFRVHAYRGGQPLDPADVDLVIELHRLGGKTDIFEFRPRDGYLLGNGVVSEPHSFDVSVRAEYEGQDYEWHYESHEGRTQIDAATAQAAGLKTAQAGPAQIREALTLQGSVEYDVERVRRAMARYPGMIVGLNARIGARVEAGDVLARVESDDSLQTYAIRAPIDGVVIKQLVNAGETTGNGILYVIADLNRVWVDLAVFRGEQSRLQVGQPVRVRSLDGALAAEAEIGYIAPVSSALSQTSTARVFLDNPNGVWRPGMAVTGEVTVREETVPLAVRNSALQIFREFDVVFAQFGETYEVRMLELGRSDGVHTEVLSGINPGTEYVVENSYLVKADIEKSGATHAH